MYVWVDYSANYNFSSKSQFLFHVMDSNFVVERIFSYIIHANLCIYSPPPSNIPNLYSSGVYSLALKLVDLKLVEVVWLHFNLY